MKTYDNILRKYVGGEMESNLHYAERLPYKDYKHWWALQEIAF